MRRSKRLLQLPQKCESESARSESSLLSTDSSTLSWFPWGMGHRKMKALLQIEAISLSKTMVHKYMNRELQPHSIWYRKRPAYHRGLAHKIFSRQMTPCTIIVPLWIYTIEVLLPVKTALLSRVHWPCVRLKKCCQVQRLSHRTWFCTRIKKVILLPQSLYNIVGRLGFLKAWAVRAVRMTMYRWNATTIL